ncbi:hypothetical protein F5Y13DRAFT_71008 [Hypoxylon sp. FL1857]|nr:hypothetical protein F5Y13DRAFT_71008 [Hypoxylon sp. FL1857]
METREEKLARWADPSINHPKGLRVLKGSVSFNSKGSENDVHILEDRIQFDQIEDRLLDTDGGKVSDGGDISSLWHFEVISLPRIRPGRLVLSIPKQAFQAIQDSWNLHPRTIEVFLSNNGVLTTFHSSNSGRASIVLKVANSRTTGFDCVSVTCDPSRRTTYVLYHHLEDEDSIFATLLSTPERCIDPHFFVAAVYRSHHQHIEAYRNTIDDTIQGIERQTGFGNPGRLMGSARRPSLDEYPALEDPKRIIQQLSYCQTDLAIIGHVARCCLDCGEWLVRAIDESLQKQQAPRHEGEPSNGSNLYERDQQFSVRLRAARLTNRDEVEYMRRRTAMLLSQVQQMHDRTQSQTSFMLSDITQNDAEYTAAIAVDGKRDSIAMKTISILGIVYLPGTFVATLFSINMFDWGGADGGDWASLTASPSMWIYWVITIPLTVITCLLWVIWARREHQKTSQRLMIYRAKSPESEIASPAETSLVGLTPSKMV